MTPETRYVQYSLCRFTCTENVFPVFCGNFFKTKVNLFVLFFFKVCISGVFLSLPEMPLTGFTLLTSTKVIVGEDTQPALTFGVTGCLYDGDS